MKNIFKTVSLLSIIAVIPAAFAATSRVSVTNKASPRLPSIAGHLVSTSTSTTTTTTSSTAAYYGVAECVEKYEDCLRAEDVCGTDFEECSTNVLFHAQMPKCSSVLYQCTSAGVQQLFGTSSIAALSNVASYVTDDKGKTTTEVAEYAYPTKNSELNNLIAGAKEGNKLTNEQCVRRYTNCIQRDDVCGSDFELCTTQKEFKKQAMLCDSTLQRCPTGAKEELFGGSDAVKSLKPSGDSRLKQMIDEGNAKAALNAVRTCQKVTDNCLVNACTKNPLRCVEGIQMGTIYTADFVSGGGELAGATSSTQNLVSDYVEDYLATQTGSDIRKMLKAQCLETIGTNKYCHMTYRELSRVSEKDLANIDLQEDVFSLAYAARKDAVNVKVQEAMKKFDTRAKNSCVDTIKSCAMRSCGGGLGSVCYTKAKGNNGVHVNDTNTYKDILSGCSAIVNADANCIYAATASGENGYTYTYYDEDNTTFSTLFPQYGSSTSDPIGAVGTLNSLLSTSYNAAAIENMRKQCQTVALSCVKSMCGKDYVNCYRNRTDIVSGTYSTENNTLNRSMNKVGGVLDYNVVIGLCMNTVKTSPVCEEHLKIAVADEWPDEGRDTTSWQNFSSVRDAWYGANTTSVADVNVDNVIVACGPSQATNGDEDCVGTMEPNVDSQGNNTCAGVIDLDNGCQYADPIYQTYAEYVLNNAGESLFQTLLADVEKEVQAKYNAKLTKEQNVCLANNAGGVMANRDNGSTFMWVKLRNNKVPKNYVSKGLTTKQMVASNDLYGSFCRARITVQSDDRDIQNLLGDKATAYFAVGDSFTCGSWISDSDLRKISDTIGNRELCKQGYGTWNSKTGECDGEKMSTKEKIAYAWGTVAPALAGGALGVGLTESGLVGTLVNKANQKNDNSFTANQNTCKSSAQLAKDNKSDADLAKKYLENAKTACGKIGAVCGDVDDNIEKTANDYITACNAATYNGATNNNKNLAARIAVPIVTGVAAGGLGAGITASVIKAKKEDIKNSAAQQWMDEVGEHIQCYIGTEELGTYGDVVSIELD